MPGFNVCQPSCLGEGAVDCADGLVCDADLQICLPVSLDSDSGGSSGGTT